MVQQKLASDKLFVASNPKNGIGSTVCSVVRYGSIVSWGLAWISNTISDLVEEAAGRVSNNGPKNDPFYD